MSARSMNATPCAVIDGQPWVNTHRDLFIPPDALDLLLDTFTGPLDVLWYLIRREKMQILDLPIRQITEQYMHYIELMKVHQMSLAVDYLVMAAWLTEIKSRCLLPTPATPEEPWEEDPRMALVEKLQQYEPFQKIADALARLPRLGRDFFAIQIMASAVLVQKKPAEASLQDLVMAMQRIVNQPVLAAHCVVAERLSVSDKMRQILDWAHQRSRLMFSDLIEAKEGRLGVVVSLLAVLELVKQQHIGVTQESLWSCLLIEPRYVRV